METSTLLAGRYRLGALVGSGGMADVHRATDELLGRDVAVKLLRPRESIEADRRRFAAEARTVAALHHPGIVTLLDAGLDHDRPFLVMELVEGETLAARLATGPLEPEQARALGHQLADALAYAHARGFIHRDVKPGNILLRPDGRACLADFGIARMADGSTTETATGQVVGSPAYVAPEQVAAGEVSPAADVYALGLVLFEALTGRRAFHGTGVEVAYARLHAAPEIPVSLGPTWVTALRAMTMMNPLDRPAAAEVGPLLDGLLVAPDEATSPFAVAAAHREPARARRAAWVATAAAALLLGGVVLAGAALGDHDGGPLVTTPTPSATPAAHLKPAARTPSPAAAPVVHHVRVRHHAVRHHAPKPAPKPAPRKHGKPKHRHGHR